MSEAFTDYDNQYAEISVGHDEWYSTELELNDEPDDIGLVNDDSEDDADYDWDLVDYGDYWGYPDGMDPPSADYFACQGFQPAARMSDRWPDVPEDAEGWPISREPAHATSSSRARPEDYQSSSSLPFFFRTPGELRRDVVRNIGKMIKTKHLSNPFDNPWDAQHHPRRR